MSNTYPVATFVLGGRPVRRMGYGAMQLAGPGAFGPPKDRGAAIAVLREAVASGVNHIDTSDFYGPHVTNRIIREALHPYPDDLVIVTKVGAIRGDDGSWLPAIEPDDIARGVHDNLRNLGLDTLDVVNMRIAGKIHAPAEGSIARQVEALAELQRKGLVRHIGLSNVTLGAGSRSTGHRGDCLRSEPLQRGSARRRRARRRTREQGNCLRAVLPAWGIHADPVVRVVQDRRIGRRHADAGCARLAFASFT